MDSFVLTSSDTNSCKSSDDSSSTIPAWKLPLSKSYSTSLSQNNENDSKNNSGGENNENGGMSDEPEETQVIQILLPCIVCNRTFSPEALERHAKVCTQVHVEAKKKPSRGKFNSAEKRIKGTAVADFIPPPVYDPPDESLILFSAFARGSRNRSSLRGTSCTTSTRLKNSAANNSVIHPPWRRERSQSQIPTCREKPTESLAGDVSESEESQATNSINGGEAVPSYARALSPSAECPYCRRSFGRKAFDRHLSFCKELFTRKQYETQPVPREKEEAMERQEIRTKYRPMKGSSSCSSLRSISPPKDFASMALKLFGMRRSDGPSNNLYSKQNNLKNNFKKSNESLTSSCYGDFNRPVRRTSPSPVRNPNNTNSNKINNLINKSYLYNNKDLSKTSLLPMRINTTSNIPKKIKSTESLPATTNPYVHVRGSGYGQQDTSRNSSSNNFSRSSKSRSSLHKNFFRSKRVEPEGTENTSTPTTPTSLIITPMNFFSKTKMSQNQNHLLHRENSMHMDQEQPRPKDSQMMMSSDAGDYDPYEKAAKQLEELLKTKPTPNQNNNKRTQRKVGLDRAFQSVTAPTLGLNFDSGSTTDGSSTSTDGPRKNSYDSISLSMTTTTDPFAFDMSTLDDSYWDQILQKTSRSRSNPSHQLKSQIADISAGDNNKSRAVSNISSADSAFSRSDGTDLEFEALETLMSLGGVPSPSPQLPSSAPTTRRSSASPSHTSLARILSPTRELSLQSNHPSSKSVSEDEINKDVPMRISSPSPSNRSAPSPLPSQNSSSSSNNSCSLQAKFCFECGTPYPTSLAKFCSECGQKRVMHRI